MKLYKNPDNSWTLGSFISIPSGSCFLREMSPGVYAVRFINVPDNIFMGAVTELERYDGTPYEDLSTFLSECGDFFVNPLSLLESNVEGLQEAVEDIKSILESI